MSSSVECSPDSTVAGSFMGSVIITSLPAGRRCRLFRRSTEPDWVFTSYEQGSGLIQLIAPGCHFLVAWTYTCTGCPTVRGNGGTEN